MTRTPVSDPVAAAIEWFPQLVAIPSLSGAEGPLADQVATWLDRPGVQVQRIGNSLLAEVCGTCSGPTLLLNSHLDTVPAGEGWERDPWRVRWQQDRLIGLGANDAKGCVAAMLAAFTALAENPDWPGRLCLALTAEEETSNRGMGEVLEVLGSPDAAITGEPTGLGVVRSQAGLAVLEARWTGSSCHAAHVARVEHRNAMLMACRELAALPDHWAPGDAHPLLGHSTLVATVLHTGNRHNQVPDQAVATFDARLVPPLTASDCLADLQSRLPMAKISIRSQRLHPVDTPASDPLVQCALSSPGGHGPIASATMSDMALLAGIPAIKVGPGETHRSHTPNEFLLKEELARAVDFYFHCSLSWLQKHS